MANRSRLSLPELAQPTGKGKLTKLPSFLQKPTLRPTLPPIEVEFDRLDQSATTDKLDRIIDCMGTLADKGPTSTEESEMSRLTELTVSA